MLLPSVAVLGGNNKGASQALPKIRPVSAKKSRCARIDNIICKNNVSSDPFTSTY